MAECDCFLTVDDGGTTKFVTVDDGGTTKYITTVDRECFSDGFDNASIDTYRWTITAGAFTETGGELINDDTDGNNSRISNNVPDMPADWTYTVDIRKITFAAGAGQFHNAFIRVETSDGKQHDAGWYNQTGTQYYRAYHETAYQGQTATALTDETFTVQRSSSTWTYKIGATTIYSASGSTADITSVLLIMAGTGGNTNQVAFDDFTITNDN